MVFPLGWIPSDAAKPRWTPGYALPDTNVADIAQLDIATQLAGAVGIPSDAGHKHQISTPQYVFIFQTPAQAIPTGSFTPITFTSGGLFTQRGGMWNIANPTRFSISVAGIYEFIGNVAFSPSTAGSQRIVAWRQNGANFLIENAIPPGAAAVTPITVVQFSFNVGDYLELMAFQDTGASLNTAVAAYYLTVATARLVSL